MERNNFLNEYLNVDIRITESTFASFTCVFKSKLAFELAKWRRKFFHHPKVPLSSRSTRSLNRSKSRFTYLLKIQDHHIHLCTNTTKKTVFCRTINRAFLPNYFQEEENREPVSNERIINLLLLINTIYIHKIT